MSANSTLNSKNVIVSDQYSGQLKYHIQTFGCQMNYSDTERVAAVLQKSGYQPAKTLEETDLFIFNTCSIKQKGEDRVYGIIKNIAQMKKANPRLLIGITGCMVRQTSSRNADWGNKDDLIKNLKPLDFVFRITDTHKLPEVLAEAEPQLNLLEIDEVNFNDYLRITPEYTTPFQAFVPIQIGCDKYCTYCIVPYSRGREQSRPMDDILAECRQLVEKGCKEITLVGQTVNSYGLSALDKKSEHFAQYHSLRSNSGPGSEPELPFISLLKNLNSLSELGLNRLRYTSPHPKDLSDQLIEAHANLITLCPYIHLPVQSGDNTVLARMNRKYTVEEYREKVQKLMRAIPNCVLSTDLIVGFSGETEEQFENTHKLFEEMRWDQAYISRYSERQGTLAQKAFPDDIPAPEKARRWHRLNNLLKVISLEKHRSYQGKNLEVLVESHNPLTNECQGKSREMKIVQFLGQPELIGTIQMIKIEQGLDWVLKGKLHL